LRGGEIYEILDEHENVINENDPSAPRVGSRRTLRLKLDPAQYQKDLIAQQQAGADNPYTMFNIVMRRKAKVLF